EVEGDSIRRLRRFHRFLGRGGLGGHCGRSGLCGRGWRDWEASLGEAAGELYLAVFHGEVEDGAGPVDRQLAEDGAATADGIGDVEGEEGLACLGLAGKEEEAVIGKQAVDEHWGETAGVDH